MSDWSLVYEGYDPDAEGHREALCTLGNGVFATRGAAPEASADGVHYPGTYLAGGYDRLVSEVEGRRVENEDLVNWPNWLPLTFRVDGGAWFRTDAAELLEYRQELDLRSGLLLRRIRLRDGSGRTTRLRERRLVHMAEPHCAALEWEITPEDWEGRLTLCSGLDGSVENAGVARYRDLAGRHLELLETEQPSAEALFLRSRAVQSRLEVALAARTRVFRDGEALQAERRLRAEGGRIEQEIGVAVRAREPLRVEKVVALHSGRDVAIPEPGLAAREAVARAPGFAALLASHRTAWSHLWGQVGLELRVPGAGDALKKLRVHCFHLLQTVSPHSVDRDVGVPARGWHGEAYRGHVFWDELFIFPFLNLRLPMLTRALLLYRYRRLPAARRAAREAGYAGAMFPWQSGSSGREESQSLHLNPRSGRWLPDPTRRQRHIGAAVAYNVWQYYQVTRDHEFLDVYGAELLLEIARFFASLATWNEGLGRYEIKGVMGPDEYHSAYPDAEPEGEGGVDNNAYTNVMAAWVLARAGDVLELLPEHRSRELRERLALGEAETERWEEVSCRLRLCFHEDGVLSQFEGFEALEELDWKAYRERYGDIQRLDRILESEGDSPNRYKVSKQADTLMLFYLFSADELELVLEQMGYRLDRDAIPRTVDYYLARTSHGSTLSWVVHSWVLSRADRGRSWRLFRGALDSDVEDLQGGTTAEGIHTGAMAGSVDILERCWLGVETRADVLHLDPSLPEEVEELRLGLRYRTQWLEIDVRGERLRVTSHPLEAEPVTVSYRGRVRRMTPGASYEFRLVRCPKRRADREACDSEEHRGALRAEGLRRGLGT